MFSAVKTSLGLLALLGLGQLLKHVRIPPAVPTKLLRYNRHMRRLVVRALLSALLAGSTMLRTWALIFLPLCVAGCALALSGAAALHGYVAMYLGCVVVGLCGSSLFLPVGLITLWLARRFLLLAILGRRGNSLGLAAVLYVVAPQFYYVGLALTPNLSDDIVLYVARACGATLWLIATVSLLVGLCHLWVIAVWSESRFAGEVTNRITAILTIAAFVFWVWA